MKTPDAEWARNKLNKTYLRLAYGKSDIEKTKKEVDGILNEVRASRDTYWKERVRKEVEKFKSPLSLYAETRIPTSVTNVSIWEKQDKLCDDILQALDNLK